MTFARCGSGGGRELLMEKDKNARTARNVIEGNLTDTAYLSQLSEELKVQTQLNLT